MDGITKKESSKAGCTYPGHDDTLHVGENVLPLLRMLWRLPRDQFLQVTGLHGRQNWPGTLGRIFSTTPKTSSEQAPVYTSFSHNLKKVSEFAQKKFW
jgi:hypothetical protein